MNVSYLQKDFQYDLVERENREYLGVMSETREDSEEFVLTSNL